MATARAPTCPPLRPLYQHSRSALASAVRTRRWDPKQGTPSHRTYLLITYCGTLRTSVFFDPVGCPPTPGWLTPEDEDLTRGWAEAQRIRMEKVSVPVGLRTSPARRTPAEMAAAIGRFAMRAMRMSAHVLLQRCTCKRQHDIRQSSMTYSTAEHSAARHRTVEIR